MGQKSRLRVDPEDFWISPKYRASDWTALQLRDDNKIDWLKAIEIAENRVKIRFVRWIERIENSQFSGFVVIALDCLLIETLVGFITGRPSTGPEGIDALLTGKLMEGGLQFADDEAALFRKHVRNGIIHDGETRRGWFIRRGESDGPVLAKKGKSFHLNRNAFHKALTRQLAAWLTKLRAGDETLRNNMKLRMEQIISKHGEAVQ
jgi:hypothetical protein